MCSNNDKRFPNRLRDLFSEFLSIEVSGELGGHFSKSKKTLGQSKFLNLSFWFFYFLFFYCVFLSNIDKNKFEILILLYDV